MSSQGSGGWPNQPGPQPGPPPGGPPPAYGQPYGQPPNAPPPYGQPPAGGPPPYGTSPYGPPPQSGAPYGQPSFGTPPYAPSVQPKRRRIWPYIVGGIVLLVIGSLVAIGVWYSHLTTSVSQIEFAQNFNTSTKKAENVATTFSSTDPTIFCVVHLNVNKGSPTVRFVWTIVDGTDGLNHKITNQKIGEQSGTTTNENILYNDLKRVGPAFAKGTYKVDFYLNDQLAKTATFTVT